MHCRARFVYRICRILRKTSAVIKRNISKIPDRAKWSASLGRASGSTIWLVFHCHRWTWTRYLLVSSAHARQPTSKWRENLSSFHSLLRLFPSNLYKISPLIVYFLSCILFALLKTYRYLYCKYKYAKIAYQIVRRV